MDQVAQVLLNNGIGAGCALAMLWLLWYRETKTFPSLTNTFTTAINAMKDACEGGLEAVRATAQQMQESFADRNNKALEVFQQMVHEERTTYQRYHDENRNKLDTLSQEVRNNRHMMNNLGQQLGLRQALEEEIERQKKATKESN